MPKQNRVYKRKNCTVRDMVKNLLTRSDLLKNF